MVSAKSEPMISSTPLDAPLTPAKRRRARGRRPTSPIDPARARSRQVQPVRDREPPKIVVRAAVIIGGEHIVAVPAEQSVVAAAPVDGVAAVLTGERLVAAAPEDDVVT